MTDLDTKLREILTDFRLHTIAWDPERGIKTEEAITQIKQAFTEAGWLKIPQIREIKGKLETQHNFVDINNMRYMTGADWLERFKRELWKPPKQELPSSRFKDDSESNDRFFRVGGENFMYNQALAAAERATGEAV